jgi:hypothetical protein
MNRLQALTTLEKVGNRLRVFGGFIDRLGLSVLRDLGGDGNIDGGGLGAKFAGHSTRRSGATTLWPLNTRPVATWP